MRPADCLAKRARRFAGLLGGGGGGISSMLSVAGLSALTGAGGMSSLPNSGALQAGQIAGLTAGLPQMAGLPPAMEKMMRKQMAQMQASAKESNETHADNEARKSAAERAGKYAAGHRANDAKHENAKRLSSAEADELAGLLERMAAAMPSEANKCKSGELKVVLHSAADMPDGRRILRMMLEPMRNMEQSLAEARDKFAQMSHTKRGEYVELMTNEIIDWISSDSFK